jgi:alkylation response protein AidB-like acyl-CoA dehydrogenase
MDFRLGEASDTLRAEAKAFIAEHHTDELREQVYRTGVSHDPAWTKALRDQGWLAPTWPEEWGGQDRDPIEMSALSEELQKVEAPGYGIGTTTMVAKVIQRAGTEEQQQEILPKALNGEIVIVLGFSEPEAGSDVANAQTKAVRDGDEWVINGSKMFTTNAHIGDYVFLLTRTNPDVPKHKGLTTFLVPMDQPGVEVQAVYTLSGERTNITFYNEVRVHDRWRIGDVDGGWRVMTGSLQDEHSGGFGAHTWRLLEHTESWAHEATAPDGTPRIEDPDVRARLARCATELEVSLLLQRRSAWMAENGMVPEAEGPMSKLFTSEALERCAEDLCEMVGPDALRSFLEPTAPEQGEIEHARRFSLGTTIYAGTSEVQRNIIAGRGLGLPR